MSKHQKFRTPWRGARLMYTPWRAFSDTSINCAARKPKLPPVSKPLAPKPLFGARISQAPTVVKTRSRVRAPQDPRVILAQTLTPIATASESQDELPLEQRILQHRKTHDLNPKLLGPAIGSLWDQIEFDGGYTQRLKLLDAQIAAATAAQDSGPLEIPTFRPSATDLEIDMPASADLVRLEPIEVRELEQIDRKKDVERFIKRVRVLEKHVFDIRRNIIFHDISVSSFLDTVLKRLYHEDIYVGRLKEMTRFWNSIDVSVRKRRRAYLDSQSWLHKVNSQSLKEIASNLKYLGESPGVPQKIRPVFMKYDRLLGVDKRLISVAGHTWRKYRSTGLYLSENSSVPEAWAFDISSYATSDALMLYRRAINDTIEEIDSMIERFRTTPRKHKPYRDKHLLVKTFESNRAVLVSSRNDLVHDFSPFLSYAICLFYARQPTSSIYWKQWEIISPFILLRALIISIRSSVSDLLNVLDVGRRGGYRMPTKVETSLWKWYREFPILWMDEFIVELEAFTEINFIRLQSEERLAKLDPNRNDHQTAVFPSGADMEKIRRWSMEMSTITGTWNDFASGDSETDISRKSTRLTMETNRWQRIQRGVNSGVTIRSTTLAISRSQPLRLNKAKTPRRSGIRSKLTGPLSLPRKPLKKRSKIPETSLKVPASKPTKKKSKRSSLGSKVGTMDVNLPVVLEPAPLSVKGTPISVLKKPHSRWLGGIFNHVPFSKYHTKSAGGFSGSPSQASNDRTDSSPSKYWSYDQNKTPDGKNITIHYCTSLQTTEQVAAHFLSETVVGLDLEWKAQASTGDALVDNVSMMQLASKERIAIFHLALFNPATSPQHLVSPTLKRILESPEIVKVGVAIRADCTRLYKFLGIQTTNLCELSRLHKLVKHHLKPNLINKRLVNLSQQVEEHLGLPLDKDSEIRCGGWSKKLTYRQVQYAATDPYAALQLFHVLESKRLQLEPVPPKPTHPVIPYSIENIHRTDELRQHQGNPVTRGGEIKTSIADN
ncbi:hypothetical protein ACJ72_03237 [Emergomyces africanus]|uniref:3'-5' exonuclease domain-containing protein n=1 Tax=Emergomyces africanus TaxID=1955775 RepID=A0A1B7P070_9EURO|nr:hypothetical protein ACJ72_03237 [Emergomyces africanus]